MKSKIGLIYTANNVKGERHYNWKGGVTKLGHKIRHSAKFYQWRKDVFSRDNWTCVWCNQRGVELHPDHIKKLSLIVQEHQIQTMIQAYDCIELWDVNNGRTLCVKCHGIRHNCKFGSKTRNYKHFICIICNKDFKISSKYGNTYKPKFCSQKCSQKHSSLYPNKTTYKSGQEPVWKKDTDIMRYTIANIRQILMV